jgi:hypothetical protein
MWQENLSQLLISMFSADELRRLLRWRYPQIEPNLPGPLSSPAALAADAVRALENEGLIDDEFFRMLRDERPRRATEIDGVVRLWKDAKKGGAAQQQVAANSAAPASGVADASTSSTLPVTAFRYDVFIAHAGPDKATAERLYDELVAARSDLRLFLDTRSLLLGDAWDQVIPQALLQSQVIVVMVSERIDSAWYAREEIAMSIELARRNSGRQRVVPLFLDGRPSLAAGGSPIPYGLRIVHGLSMPDTTLPEAAAQLVRLVERIRT